MVSFPLVSFLLVFVVLQPSITYKNEREMLFQKEFFSFCRVGGCQLPISEGSILRGKLEVVSSAMVWVGGFGVLLFFIYTLEYVTQIPDNFFWLWEKVDESNTGGNYNEALNFDRKFCQQEGVLHSTEQKILFMAHTYSLLLPSVPGAGRFSSAS